MMESSDWAPEHSGALREYHALGMSFSEIARAINAKFGTRYSRNATIGRAKRIGVGLGSQPADTEQPLDLAPVVPKEQPMSSRALRHRLAAMSKWSVPEFERVEMPKLRCVDIEPRHLSLPQLEAGDCRYPYGGDAEDEAITFCGHPRREGSSYCPPHVHLTRGSNARLDRMVKALMRTGEVA